MSEKLYNFVSSLSRYEDIIKDCSVGDGEVNIKPCNSSIFIEGCDDSNFSRNYLTAEKYITNLRSNVYSHQVENACKYFSYWVYKKMIMEKGYRYKVSEIHKSIMQNNNNINICENYVEDITPDIFKNIDDLVNLHKKFIEILNADDVIYFDCGKAKICVDMYNRLEKNCYLNSDNPFCIGLENFRQGYNRTMERKDYCPQYKTLQPFQEYSEKSANTIATAAITAISFASIMTYKFTPLGSWVRHRFSGNKNLRNKLEKEFKVSQNSSELQDMEYRVPYNSS